MDRSPPAPAAAQSAADNRALAAALLLAAGGATPGAAKEPDVILAIFAHRDDAELVCGGTLAQLGRQGRRTGILDLTQGE
ncbi:MAG: bacillithiol biosynthesis deacetylase BshB1, partial [Alkalinema sp. RU_4_3]|nr:bacillithiol biosynthesis deacetylase BshB1 [Alkalinema sp. RU_4_3]